jgi:hypothetical protein
MANIRIRDRKTGTWTHEVAVHNTERTVNGTLYAERWALRSDGAILHRIRYTESDLRGRTDHTSGYAHFRHNGKPSVFPERHRNDGALREFLGLIKATVTD